MSEVDNHRRELLDEHCDLLRLNKPFVNMPTWEIEAIFINKRDRNRFSEEEMLKSFKGFLRRQKGISLNRGTDTWEIRPPLSP